MNRLKRMKIVFFIYIAVVVKVIIFKYPWAELQAIMAGWEKDVILEGLDTANFTLFKTIKMYIKYSYMLNSFENLVGNVVVFIPFGFLLPYIQPRCSAFGAFDVDDILLNCVGAAFGWIAYVEWEAFRKKWQEVQRQKIRG